MHLVNHLKSKCSSICNILPKVFYLLPGKEKLTNCSWLQQSLFVRRVVSLACHGLLLANLVQLTLEKLVHR